MLLFAQDNLTVKGIDFIVSIDGDIVKSIHRPKIVAFDPELGKKSVSVSYHPGNLCLGFAVDVDGVKNLSKSQLKALNALAKEHGLAPLLNQAADPPHFDTDPTKRGYKSLKEAADENKAHYDNIQKGKAEAIKFDQKQYEEYKKKKEDENKK